MPLGIDVGGTKILVAGVEGGKIVNKRILNTVDGKVIETLRLIIRDYSGEKIGIGIPGYLVGKTCVRAPHIKELAGVDFSEIFPTAYIMNDCTAMAYGEYFLRDGKYQSLLLIALGSGVGAGLIVNGRPYMGRGSALEIGHLKGFSEKMCGCGKTGCFETVAGGKYLPDMKTLADRARMGDDDAVEFYREYGRTVAKGIAHAIQLLDPEIVVFGGGIGKSLDLFLESMKEELDHLLSFVSVDDIIFEKMLSYESGALGAALIAERDLL